MTDETTPTTPAPDLATIQAAHETLKGELAAAKKLVEDSRKSSEQKDAEIKRINEAYQRDVNTLAAYAAQLSQGSKAAEKPDDGDDDGFVTKRDLKAMTADLGSTFQEHITRTITPLEGARARDQRDLNRRDAKRTLEHFSKYEKEIETLLDSQPPEVAAKPGAYEAAYKLVLSTHVDELVEAKLAEARKPAVPDDPEGDDEETEPEAARSTHEAAPVATPAASGPRPAMRRTKVAPLSSDEKYAAERMGFESAEEYRKWQNPQIETDPFGFKGRNVV